jgi:hypothetical protein
VKKMAEESLSEKARREVLQFVQTNEFINMDMPVSQLLESVGRMEGLTGNFAIWDRYAIVVAAQDQTEQP